MVNKLFNVSKFVVRSIVHFILRELRKNRDVCLE